jgi:hypothetical protein
LRAAGAGDDDVSPEAIKFVKTPGSMIFCKYIALFVRKLFVSILITVRGDMTMAEVRQALFEVLLELEDELAVRHTRNVSLFINPTDEVGEKLVVRNRLGGVVSKVTKKGPYRSAADEYSI